MDGRYQAVHILHGVLFSQAYLIAVTCRDNSRYVIYRRYQDFHDMHSHLEERFPIEAGAISAKDRTLPTLPGVCLSPPPSSMIALAAVAKGLANKYCGLLPVVCTFNLRA